MLFLCTAPADAAVTLKALSSNKTYKQYDVTYDGKKDSIKYKHSDSAYYLKNHIYTMSLYVNGKRISKTDSSRGGTLYYCRFDNKNVFLIEALHYAGGATDYSVYACSKGKVQKIKTGFDKLNLFYFKQLKRTKDKKRLYIESSQKSTMLKSFPASDVDTDKIVVRHLYYAKNGQIYLSSRAGTVVGSPKFIANWSCRLSKSVSKINVKNGPYISSGETVKLKKVYFTTDGSWRYYITGKNGSGWLADSADVTFRQPDRRFG